MEVSQALQVFSGMPEDAELFIRLPDGTEHNIDSVALEGGRVVIEPTN